MRNRSLSPLFASLLYLGLGGCLSAVVDEPLSEAGDWGREPAFSIGGRVRGAAGTLTLQNSNGAQLTVRNGAFRFETPMVSTAWYHVTVAVPHEQLCKVSNGSGTVGQDDITDVLITCEQGPDRESAKR